MQHLALGKYTQCSMGSPAWQQQQLGFLSLEAGNSPPPPILLPQQLSDPQTQQQAGVCFI
ncbi:MAG: hypothetical protein U1D30_18800 [Planctomycetota bacterium]